MACNGRAEPQVMVIGIDGASWNVLNLMITRGAMPNLKGLVNTGVSGSLRSTIPPTSPPAWTSFMTGKNPGKHGVFSWGEAVNLRFDPVNALSIHGKTLWQLLGEYGKRVGVFNVPMTYPLPSYPIHGFFITGFLTPSVESDFIYPASLRSELLSLAGDYIIDVPWLEYGHRKNGRQALMKDLAAELEQKGKIALALLERYETNFFMVVFAGPDRISHCLWQYIGLDGATELDAEGQEIQEMIHAYYRQLDDILGRILKHAGPDTSVLVISDHGFGPIRKELYINKWLAEQGFLMSASNPRSAKVRTALRTLARRLGITRDRWRQALGPGATKAAQALVNTVRIDWSRTKAYSNGVNTVQVNLKGREPYGIINSGDEYEEVRAQVIERLAELRDPETGRRVVKAIIPREKAGTGPNLGQAPDILMLMADEGYAAYECDVDVDQVFEAPRWRNGEHTLEGVLTAAGKHINKGSTIVGATIMDLAPTILYRMGLPIPDDMDGQVLTDLFDHQFLGDNTPLKARTFEQAADRHVSAGERDADEETILERLKGLGYID
ncbi:MAG: alkaline phosphatase family protein [Anaerolineales bacterium]|nr:MAG: alkaline phosphatase family protein [Anaerolineales bacterium]